MKKLISVSIFIFLSVVSSAYAASSTPTPTPKPAIEQQIDDLKDRIASRVAELKLVEKRGILGTVIDISDTQITLKDVKGDTRFVDVDELTKFFGDTKNNGAFGISDIEKGQELSVIGLYNKQSRRILARVIETEVNPKMEDGSVASIDPTNFVLNVRTSGDEQISVEFETTTKSYAFTKSDKNLVRAGFSKIVAGETIFVVGFPDKKIKNQLDLDRVIVFPDFVKAPQLVPAPSIVPSTGSGKKLTPIVR